MRARVLFLTTSRSQMQTLLLVNAFRGGIKIGPREGENREWTWCEKIIGTLYVVTMLGVLGILLYEHAQRPPLTWEQIREAWTPPDMGKIDATLADMNRYIEEQQAGLRANELRLQQFVAQMERDMGHALVELPSPSNTSVS